jgi:cysteinyl-tRNA synthetase
VHYRGPIQFDTETLPNGRVVFPGVDEAERRVDYLYTTIERLRGLVSSGQTVPAKLPKELIAAREEGEKAVARADAALDDDLNTTVAIAELGEIAKYANEICDLAARRQKDMAFAGGASVVARGLELSMGRIMGELGMLQTAPREYRRRTTERRLRLRGLGPDAVLERVRERIEARRAKDFVRSDAIRAELEALGVSLHDSPDGSTWKIDVSNSDEQSVCKIAFELRS